MKRSTRAFVAAVVVWMFLLWSCDEGSPDTDAGVTILDAGTGDDAGAGGDDAGTGGDTWSSFAMGFFATYCTECHAGGRRNFTTITEVGRDATTIRCGVSTVVEAGCGSFPPPSQFPIGGGPFPSAAERTRLVDWLNTGLPE